MGLLWLQVQWREVLPSWNLSQLWTRSQRLAPWGGTVGVGQAAGALEGVLRRQGAGLSRRHWPFCGAPGTVEAGFTLTWYWDQSPPWTRSQRLAPWSGAAVAEQAADPLGGVSGRAGSRPESQVWAFCEAQTQWRGALPSHGTFLHPGPDPCTLHPRDWLWRRPSRRGLEACSVGAGLRGRYGPLVGHRCSGGRVYPHMEPFFTLESYLAQTTALLGRAATVGQAAGPLNLVLRRAGSRPESQVWAFLWSTGAVEGGFTLNLARETFLHSGPDLCAWRPGEERRRQGRQQAL
jgi:hypothetical protein